MPGPSGDVGAGKLAAAKSAQAKRLAFLTGLRVNCSDEARELITGTGGKVLVGKAIDLAVQQSAEVAEGKATEVSFTFTDKRGRPIALVEIVRARQFVNDCQRTINKWETPKKKSVKVRRNRSEDN